MKLDSLRVSRYTIPLPHPMADARREAIRDFGLVVVEAGAGDSHTGLGYTYTVGTAGSAAIEALIADDLAPLLKGCDPRRTEDLWQRMWMATHYAGRGGPASFAISAVDIALWDLKAKALSEPLWRLLGGACPDVQAYAGGIDLNLDSVALGAQTRANIERGFGAIKVKVGHDRLGDDLERVGLVRQVVGPDVPLMVDANMKWSVAEAIRASRKLASLDVYWLEEPTEPDDFAGHARIQREGPLPVAAGENLHTLTEFRSLIAAGGVAFPEPDVTNCGGVTTWMKVAHMAEAYGLPVTSHGVHDLHVSLLAAVPNASFLEFHGFGLEPYLEHPLEIDSGIATAADRPGHGIGFKSNALEPFRCR